MPLAIGKFSTKIVAMTRLMPVVLLCLSAGLSSRAGAADREDVIEAWPSVSSPIGNSPGGALDAAVIVAIDSYANLPRVQRAVDNGRDWQIWLSDVRKLRPEALVLLRDQGATRFKVRAAIKRALEEVRPGGKLWFVFIGHGSPLPTDAALMMYDSETAKDSVEHTALLRSELYDILTRSVNVSRAIVILDACFTGFGPDRKTAVTIPTGAQPAMAVSLNKVEKAVVVAAAGPDEYAGSIRTVLNARRPALSYLMLGALRGWGDGVIDDKRDGKVTIQEATKWAQRALRATLDRPQTPSVVGEGGDEVIARDVTETGPNLAKVRRILDDAGVPDDPPMASVTKGAGGGPAKGEVDGYRVASWVGYGVGAVGAVAAGVFAYQWAADQAIVDKNCGSGNSCTDIDAVNKADAALKTEKPAAIASGTVAVLGIGAGLLFGKVASQRDVIVFANPVDRNLMLALRF